MHFFIIRIFILLISISLGFAALAQGDIQLLVDRPLDKPFRTAGGIAGYGKDRNSKADYSVLLLAGDFSWSFRKAPQKRVFASWYAEPQINPVRNSGSTELEFGTNLGFRTYFVANPNLYFYHMIGAGPHFITARVQRQARGFIFSDNTAVGALVRLRRTGATALHLQLRYRHLSNAGLKDPNGGIDSWIFGLGLSKIK